MIIFVMKGRQERTRPTPAQKEMSPSTNHNLSTLPGRHTRRIKHPTIQINHLFEAFGETERAESLGLACLDGADIAAHHCVRGTAERVLRQGQRRRLPIDPKGARKPGPGGRWVGKVLIEQPYRAERSNLRSRSIVPFVAVNVHSLQSLHKPTISRHGRSYPKGQGVKRRVARPTTCAPVATIPRGRKMPASGLHMDQKSTLYRERRRARMYR